MNKLLRVFALLVVLLGLGISCASAANVVVSFNPQTVELNTGSSQNVQIVMDKVPIGLSGFNIKVSVLDPKSAEITAISFPNWAMMHTSSTLPSSSVWIKAVDLSNQVVPGSTNVLLGTITLTGKMAGTTSLSILPKDIDDDNGGSINSDTVIGKVHVLDKRSPVAAFSATPSMGYTPLKVTFTDRSTGTPTSWKWSFGDGKYSTVKNPIYTYSKEGKYTVSLTVKNTAESNTVTKSNYIVLNVLKLPVAAFAASPLSGKAPLTVKFTDKSAGSPTSWSWNFGDKSTSTVKNPVHKYTKVGKYTVSLTVKNAKGGNTKKIFNYITVKSK